MITCPWCGTSYLRFQPNCQNCGGPLLGQPDGGGSAVSVETPAPPAAPRTISNRYIWRLLFSDGWWIAALVFTLLGGIFSLVGSGLALGGRFTLFIGLIFLVLGIPFLAAGVGVFVWRYRNANKVVTVLREGSVARGKITDVRENYSVEINGRHPWIIAYEYQAMGQPFSGSVSTLNRPAGQMQAGNMAWVLYLAGEPKWSSIYPHP